MRDKSIKMGVKIDSEGDFSFFLLNRKPGNYVFFLLPCQISKKSSDRSEKGADVEAFFIRGRPALYFLAVSCDFLGIFFVDN